MIHEQGVKTQSYERFRAGDRRALVTKHDQDFQVGDELHLVLTNEWGHRTYHYVERDEKGRFANERVLDAPVRVEITHVLPAHQTAGLTEGMVLLSFALLEDQ